jgi:cysteine synthase A
MGWLPASEHWLNWASQPRIKHFYYGALIGFSLSYTTLSFTRYLNLRKQKRQAEIFESRPIELRSDEIVSGVTGLIGVCIFNQKRNYATINTMKGIRLWLG